MGFVLLLIVLPFAALADLAPMMPPSIEEHPCLVLLTFVGLVIVSVMTGNKVCGKLMDKMKCRFGVSFGGFRKLFFGGLVWLFLVAILIAGSLGLWAVAWRRYDEWSLHRWQRGRERAFSGERREAAQMQQVIPRAE